VDLAGGARRHRSYSRNGYWISSDRTRQRQPIQRAHYNGRSPVGTTTCSSRQSGRERIAAGTSNADTSNAGTSSAFPQPQRGTALTVHNRCEDANAGGGAPAFVCGRRPQITTKLFWRDAAASPSGQAAAPAAQGCRQVSQASCAVAKVAAQGPMHILVQMKI